MRTRSDRCERNKLLAHLDTTFSAPGVTITYYHGNLNQLLNTLNFINDSGSKMKTMNASEARNKMVDQQVVARGVKNKLVVKAMRTVPREAFLPENLRESAYEDTPLPIAANQTISQPYIVAFMVEALALKGGEKVLEIGAGSGYAAAILAEIASKVYTIERVEELAEQASETLLAQNYLNVQVKCGDGTHGWPEQAPFDAIVVAASGPRVPKSLKSQLKIGGRMLVPVGPSESRQELVRVTRISQTVFKTEDIADVRFVPLIGDEGWNANCEDAAV